MDPHDTHSSDTGSQSPRSAESLERQYEITRERLLRDPSDVEAWLVMSRLVPDAALQQECLDQATALMQGGQGIPGLSASLSASLRPQPASAAPVDPAPVPAGATPRRIGEYLIVRGAISPQQLDDALGEQRQRRRNGDLVPIGDILVRRKLVTARVLAETLVEMHLHNLRVGDSPPFLLGEYLLAAGVITAEQLADVLEEQIKEAQAGRYALFGTIAMQRGILAQADLDLFLERQRTQRGADEH
jgi:hypothetical protein